LPVDRSVQLLCSLHEQCQSFTIAEAHATEIRISIENHLDHATTQLLPSFREDVGGGSRQAWSNKPDALASSSQVSYYIRIWQVA
jgi:hypothetical protein